MRFAVTRLQRLGIVTGMAFMSGISAFGQTDLPDPTPRMDRGLRIGPAQSGISEQSTVLPGLPYFSRAFNSFGRNLTMNIVGTDPGAGQGSTIVPTFIVPLRFVFSTGTVLDGTNVVPTTVNSPIFQTVDYTTGGTDLGTTQYGDAIQRAEFWNFTGFSQAGYHVLLGQPTIAPAVTINVPAANGVVAVNSRGTLVGRVDDNYFEGTVLPALVAQYPAFVLPFFLSDNVFLYQGVPANCCIVGFHNSEGPPTATARTWIFCAYVEFNTVSGNGFLDVLGLSHEVSEWLNDPFVGNFAFDGSGINLVAPFVVPGQGGACQINLETGDALESGPTRFTKIVNGTTYTLQDEALLPWFFHFASFSVNGFYSFLGTFRTPAALCGAG